MISNKLIMEPFICWEHGENYPFSACMKKLMECLNGDLSFYTYDFFAGLSGDDFVMCYGNNGRFNDCVSVCEDTKSFLDRTFGRIGLQFEYLPVEQWRKDPDNLKRKVREFIDRGVPVLVKSEGADANYSLLFEYNENGDVFSVSCGDPAYNKVCQLPEENINFIFIDNLPVIRDIRAVYRESILQIPVLMRSSTKNGVTFGADAYRKWADDLEKGRYAQYTSESFDQWRDWCIYVCNLATNARHGWDFIAKAYVSNTDIPNILHLIRLLDRNEDIWRNELEKNGVGFNVTLENLQDATKCKVAAMAIRKLAKANDEIIQLF